MNRRMLVIGASVVAVLLLGGLGVFVMRPPDLMTYLVATAENEEDVEPLMREYIARYYPLLLQEDEAVQQFDADTRRKYDKQVAAFDKQMDKLAKALEDDSLVKMIFMAEQTLAVRMVRVMRRTLEQSESLSGLEVAPVSPILAPIRPASAEDLEGMNSLMNVPIPSKIITIDPRFKSPEPKIEEVTPKVPE